MDLKELEQELSDLKAKVERHHQIILVMLNGDTLLNKRMDMLESLAQSLGVIANITHAQLERHLELFRDAGAPREPKPSKDTQRGIEVG